jgi:hypothetical protein
MSFAQIKEEVMRLPNEERRAILALLLKARAEFDTDWMIG